MIENYKNDETVKRIETGFPDDTGGFAGEHYSVEFRWGSLVLSRSLGPMKLGYATGQAVSNAVDAIVGALEQVFEMTKDVHGPTAASVRSRVAQRILDIPAGSPFARMQAASDEQLKNTLRDMGAPPEMLQPVEEALKPRE